MTKRPWLLFLDDERFPPDLPGEMIDLWESLWDQSWSRYWVIARSMEEVKKEVYHRGQPTFISFDHDLGDGPTGMDVAKWLIDQHLDGNHFPKNFNFTVHSMNPIGAANIQGIMDSFLRLIRDQ